MCVPSVELRKQQNTRIGYATSFLFGVLLGWSFTAAVYKLPGAIEQDKRDWHLMRKKEAYARDTMPLSEWVRDGK